MDRRAQTLFNHRPNPLLGARTQQVCQDPTYPSMILCNIKVISLYETSMLYNHTQDNHILRTLLAEVLHNVLL